MLRLKIKVGQYMLVDQSVKVFLRKKKGNYYFEAVPVRGAAPRVVQFEGYTQVGECKFAVVAEIGSYRMIAIVHPPRIHIIPEDKHSGSRAVAGGLYAF